MLENQDIRKGHYCSVGWIWCGSKADAIHSNNKWIRMLGEELGAGKPNITSNSKHKAENGR